MKRYVSVVVVAFLTAAAVVGVAAADAGPLADAGLDQEVGTNTTVQLDGTGSSHPDGTIDGYEWSIETPAGARTTPACVDCGRTSFRPTEFGRHNVTVVVTDSEGRSSTDTLYVYVRDFGPTVRLNGDTDPRTGERAPYEAIVKANGSELEGLTWRVDGRTIDRETISGRSSATERRFRFSGSRPYRLAVVAEDATGRSDRDTLVVEPRTDSDPDSRRDDAGSFSDGSRGDSGDDKDKDSAYLIDPLVSGGAPAADDAYYASSSPTGPSDIYRYDSSEGLVPNVNAGKSYSSYTGGDTDIGDDAPVLNSDLGNGGGSPSNSPESSSSSSSDYSSGSGTTGLTRF